MVRRLLTVARRQLHTFIPKETIKPSSPTPPHLKTYNLSFTDQIKPSIHMPLVFFYPYDGSSSTIATHQEKAAQLLKKSLSQTLTQYYPFAGRLVDARDGAYVDCNDEGVEFVESRVKTQLSKVVEPHKVGFQSLDTFFPTAEIWEHEYDSLVKVQLSYFDCGGLAIAVSLCHRIGDGCTLGTFINYWAAVTHNHYSPSDDEKLRLLPPHFISFPKSIGSEIAIEDGSSCVHKKFTFPNSKIEQLKAEVVTAAQFSIMNPTRVEVLNSLLYRCAVRARKANENSFLKVNVLVQVVNMRKRLANSLPGTTVGNVTWAMQLPTISESQLALNSLTARIKKAKLVLTDVTDSQLRKWQTQVLVASTYLPRKYFQPYVCSSMCGYGLYQVDFGWGNPIRVSFPRCLKNFFLLMETPSGDGIEALVTMEEEDMARFQADEQLLAYAA